MSDELITRAKAALEYEDGYPVNICGKHTGRASNRCLLPVEHDGPCDDDPPPLTFPEALASELVAEVETLRTALQSECQCWVGHGGCGGCSGVIGYGHEPTCGWEWNPRCPEHGVIAKENAKLRAAIETIRGVASTRATSAHARGHRGYERAFLDILAVIERIEKP